jgi:hypothetical protein
MRNFRWYLTVLVVFLFVNTTPAFAMQFGGTPLDGFKVPDGKLAWQISKAFETTVSADQVAFLRNDLSYGEIALVYALSDSSGKSAADVFAWRKDDGLTWNKVAQKCAVKLSDVTPAVSSILKSAKLDVEDKTLKAELDQENVPGAKQVVAVTPEKAAKKDEPKGAYNKDVLSRQ